MHAQETTVEHDYDQANYPPGTIIEKTTIERYFRHPHRRTDREGGSDAGTGSTATATATTASYSSARGTAGSAYPTPLYDRARAQAMSAIEEDDNRRISDSIHTEVSE